MEQLRIAKDDRQQVVVIVGQSTGELPDGFHLLTLMKLRLEFYQLGNVTDSAAHGLYVALLVSDRDGGHVHVPNSPVPVHEPRPAAFDRPVGLGSFNQECDTI